MRTVRYMEGDITTEISDLNVNYNLLFTEMNIKGQVFGIDENGGVVKMMVDRFHRIRAITIVQPYLAKYALSSYLGETNGNAFAVVHPQKEDWFNREVSYKGCKTQNVLDEKCR
ncbi:hypothetical protein HYU07_07310 [Candidatus Woesearchaeota archaeon]|nr:hypothetical protein [Candidatus Woesearchaeota archaeon]